MMQQAILIMKNDPVDFNHLEEIVFSTMTSFHNRLDAILCQPIESEAELDIFLKDFQTLNSDMQAYCHSLKEGHTRAQPGYSLPGTSLHFAEKPSAATA